MISVSDTSSYVDDEFAGFAGRDFRLALVNLNFLIISFPKFRLSI